MLLVDEVTIITEKSKFIPSLLVSHTKIKMA
jgi:hypothetical protein